MKAKTGFRQLQKSEQTLNFLGRYEGCVFLENLLALTEL